MNSKEVTALINKILEYSAMKIKAKPPPLYSVLNPDTSSDSLSAKSKGVRLVSANVEISHITARGVAVNINHASSWNRSSGSSLMLPINTRMHIKIKAKLTSYEMVWAIARKQPNKGYLELDDHPALKRG